MLTRQPVLTRQKVNTSRATVLAIADELTGDELALRYRVGETGDRFSGEEGRHRNLTVLAGGTGVRPPGRQLCREPKITSP